MLLKLFCCAVVAVHRWECIGGVISVSGDIYNLLTHRHRTHPWNAFFFASVAGLPLGLDDHSLITAVPGRVEETVS